MKKAARLVLLGGIGAVMLWNLILSGLAWIYVDRLLNPVCAASDDLPPPGFQAVLLSLKDGTLLRGWWHAPENGTIVILLGGHGANRDAFLPEAEMLARRGFGALTLDYRHCAGKPVSLGIHEGEELQRGLTFTHDQSSAARIVVWGFSAGGAAAIHAAADTPEIAAVISMGNYANLYDEITNSSSVRPPSLDWQLQEWVALALWARTGVWPGSFSPIDDLARIHPRPVFLIFGSLEVDRARGYEQFAAAGDPKALWVVPEAGHGEYRQAAPLEYEQKIVDFLSGIN